MGIDTPFTGTGIGTDSMALNFYRKGKGRIDGSLQTGSAATTAAVLLGAGTSTTREQTSTANTNFIGYWVETTATSGDTRGIYTRLYFSGAGVSGEAARFYGTVNNVTAATGGTVNGAHISLSVTGASGKISGSGNALRATLEFTNTPTAIGGTVAVLRLDTSIAAGPTIPTGTAFIAINDLGAQNLDYFVSAETVGTTLFADAGTGANSAGNASGGVAAKVLKCRVGGVDYWLPLFSSNAS